jgi:hypothetical protein
MSKSTVIILLILFNSSFYSHGQQRIGLDISTRMTNLMFTTHYQKVIKNRFLFSIGVFGGNHGHAFVKNDTLALYSNNQPQSPYNRVNEVQFDTTGNHYYLLDYRSTGSSIGIQAGLGYFHEFDPQHGLRTNINATVGYVGTHVTGYYRSTHIFREILAVHHQAHWVASISLEAYHTIRLSGRLTFNYGVKVPFFYSIDQSTFNPTTHKDLLYGFEPHLSIGITRVIGKCD